MVLITTINHNFPPDTSSDFLATVQTDGQMTDRQTDRQTSCRIIQPSNGVRQISLFIPLAHGVCLKTHSTHTDLP